MKVLGTILLFSAVLSFASCVNTRTLQFVEGQFDTARYSKFTFKEPVIQVGDLISIIVFSDNPQATALFNLSNVTSGNTQNITTLISGYLVDQQGNIQFQGIGNLRVEGLNKQELTALLDSKLTAYLKNPYYTIRFINYQVTMLGEVLRQGLYTIPNEKVNIFEAIGLAGGLTVYARRENVMVIRESNGKREFARLDLTKPEVFQSPYYYLQQNDMVVVEQNRAKAVVSDQVTARNISLTASVISTLALIYSVIKR